MAPDVGPAPTLHERRRVREMQRVQRRAVELFAANGFAAVSVEQVAEAAEVAPVSIYRWFGTKEQLVLWDHYDPGLLEAVASALAERDPLEAVRHAVVTTLDAVYDLDRELVLARSQLIHAEPALLAAARNDARHLELALSEVFAAAGTGGSAFARSVLAAAAVGVLTAAVAAWQDAGGHTPLADFVDRGFGVLAEQR